MKVIARGVALEARQWMGGDHQWLTDFCGTDNWTRADARDMAYADPEQVIVYSIDLDQWLHLPLHFWLLRGPDGELTPRGVRAAGVKPLVLYHDNCPDGFTAAWAVFTALGDEAEYRGVNYGNAPPDDVHGRRVIIVDFSYPRAQLDALANHAASVEVYDHHKTAEADLRDWTGGKCVFDMKRSGAMIAWDEFNPSASYVFTPKLVTYVQDRDLWTWALPQSRAVSEFLFSIERTFSEWQLAADDIEQRFDMVVQQGTALLRAKRQRVALMCKHARWGRIGGKLCRYVNASWDFSEIGEYLSDPAVAPEAEFGAYYFDRADMRQWGMRARRDDVDVSAIAKALGGGGHRAAAGFQTAIGWLPDPA